MTDRVSRLPRASLLAAVLAAVGASACCIGPLVLLGLGVGGAWIGTLTVLEPYRPVFIGLALLFLFLAYRRLYRAPAVCAAGGACADPAPRHRQRLVFWAVAALMVALITFPYYGAVFLS